MASGKELVSVIIPCFNQGEYISDAIQSVMAQTYIHWECIIIDDGSHDNTTSVVQQFLTDTRIRYLRQDNQGVAAARNAGLAHAKGDFIQFLDGDDLIAPDKFRLQLGFMETNPGVDIVYGISRYFFHGRRHETFAVNQEGNNPTVDIRFDDKHQAATLALRNLAPICAPLYRKAVIDTPTPFENIIFEDWLFHLDCSLKSKVFHYEPMIGTACFIRMTTNSQMFRHKALYNRDPSIFPTAVKNRLKRYHCSIPFTIYVPELPPRNVLKETIKLFIPPLLTKIVSRVKNNKHTG
jgi:glycosyltransferase involved in cell wall biosynthesis